MSTGQYIGTGVGAVIGGIVGAFVPAIGPWTGVMLGGSIGMAVGYALNPMSYSSRGQPDVNEFKLTICQEGTPITDLVGTVKIKGNILYQESHRVHYEHADSGGKGGSSDSVVTGEHHYLSFAVGVCLGPVDSLYAIWNGQDVVWSGNLRLEDATNGLATIDQVGTPGTPFWATGVSFYFGTDDQDRSGQLAFVGDITLQPTFRHLCYIRFVDAYVGGHAAAPDLAFVIRKSPQFAFNANYLLNTYDSNPAHMLWYILTESMQMDESLIDEDSFSEEADVLAAEGFGLSALLNGEEEGINWAATVLRHIRATMLPGSDGRFKLQLLRGDEDADEMPHFDEDDLLEEPTINRPAWSQVMNQFKVNYTERVDN